MRRRRYLRGPGSESAGYHGDLSIPHYHPKTPTAAPPPSEAARGPAGNYSGAGAEYSHAVASLPEPARTVTQQATERAQRAQTPLVQPTSTASNYLLNQLQDLLTPGPTAKETAEAAHRLGVKPKGVIAQIAEDVAGPRVGQVAKTLEGDVTHAVGRVAQAAAAPQALHESPKRLSGHKVLGAPTLGQLIQAASRGEVRTNQRGKVTIPVTRHAARSLAQARQRVQRTSRPNLSGLSPQERAVAPIVLKAGKKYGIPASVLMAQIRQESGFNPSAVSGAGAFGLSQFIPSTAASYGVKPGPSRAAERSQVFGEAHYLSDLGFQRDPQQALSSYSGGYAASDYNNPILQGARDYAALDRPGRPNPQALARLLQAKGQAAKLGIPTKASQPINGDVHPSGSPGIVFVRSDAKGMTQWAQSALGVKEGSQREAKWAAAVGISPTTPWCSAFIAAGLARRGIRPPSDPAYSGSWLNWSGGKHIKSFANAKPGDLLIFDWGDGGITDHVALYTGNGQMISGNDSNNSVGQSSVPSGNIVGIVRPNYKGGKVAVRESAPLPGGSSIGIGAAAPAAGAVPAGGGAGGAQGRPAAPVSLAAILTPGAASAPLPTAFRQFQLGEAPEVTPQSEGVIAELLRRKKL